METIFMSIASYRDCELRLTIKDAIEKAKFPERLKFGICWQRDEDEYLGPFANHPQVRLISYPYQESKGACWARAKTQELYDDETYWLQVDSHTRFLQDWDEVIIDDWKKTEDPKACLSAYPRGYKIDFFNGKVTIENANTHALKLTAQKIHHDFFIQQNSVTVDTRTLNKPGKGRFSAGGLIFGPGQLLLDVPYDPNYYFLGEEIAFAIRAFTWGYNLYYPSKNTVFHNYRGKGESGPQGRAWQDNAEWTKFHAITQKRFRALVIDKDFELLGKWGPGPHRTIEDFEIYAGLNFKTRDIHPDCISGKDPNPVTITNSDWLEGMQAIHLTFEGISEFFDPGEITFWCTAIFDEAGKQIIRYDIKEETILKLTPNKGVLLQYISDRRGKELMVWPYFKEGGFKKKIWTKIPESWWRPRVPTSDLDGGFDGDDNLSYWHKMV